MEQRQELKMAGEEESSQVSNVTKVAAVVARQMISVPFIWEVTPGLTKKDWKPTPATFKLSVPPPVTKLIASVPFEWEENPGKPLPCCFQLEPANSPFVPQKIVSNFPSPVKLIASVPFEWEEKPGKPLPFFKSPSRLPFPQIDCHSSPSFPGLSEGNIGHWISMNNCNGDESEMLESYPETCEYETDDDSFTSAPSFSADNLTETMVVVPQEQTSSKVLDSLQWKSPDSPTTETENMSSHATGTTSLVGASFLEWLFPQLAPRSSVLDKVGCSEGVSQMEPKKQCTDFHQERNYSAAIRRPQTLGELIMMSRRRSYQRKAIQMQKENFSKEIMKTNAMGCGICRSSNILSMLDMKLKRQLQLKFA